jgi:hypothetical protein
MSDEQTEDLAKIPCSFCCHTSTVTDTRVVFATKDRVHAVCSKCVEAFSLKLETVVTLDMLDEGRMTKH